MRSFIGLITISLFWGCSGDLPVKKKSKNATSTHFNIENHEGFSLITIYNPWQNAEGEAFKYIVRDADFNLSDSLSNVVQIIRPVKKIIVLSTTHIGYIAALGKEKSIIGVSGKDFIYNPIVRKGISEGKVFDIGFAPAIAYEKILEMDPDVVLLYGLGSSISGIAQRLMESGIKSLIIAEYLENDPLRKMEWIKVIASLYGSADKADSLLNYSKNEYERLAAKVRNRAIKPRVLMGLPWKDIWYMSAGNSITAQYIRDAGGKYLWDENEGTEFIPLDLESAFSRALSGDIWINAGSARSLKEIEEIDKRFTLLPAYLSGEVYNNNARLNEFGGNDFWESGVVHPELILRDLIKIFHPDLAEVNEFVYYRKLNYH